MRRRILGPVRTPFAGLDPTAGSRASAIAVLSLALLTACATTGGGRLPAVTPPGASPSPEGRSAGTPTAPPGPDSWPEATATLVFRLSVTIDGTSRPFPASSIRLLRTDVTPPPPSARPRISGDPRIRSLEGEDWYAADLPPGRYHLNAVSKWRFPTARGIAPLVVELRPEDRIAYAGSIRMSCRAGLPPETPGTKRYDCDPPEIGTDDAATAVRLLGRPEAVPAIRPARPLSSLTAPDLSSRAGRWTLEVDRDETAGLPLQPFPDVHEAATRDAVQGGVAVVGSLSCGPFFVFCVAIMIPAAAVGAALDEGVEHHGNTVRAGCNERIGEQLSGFDVEGRLLAALEERFAAAGRPLEKPGDAPGGAPPSVALRVAVIRVGVRGDNCVAGLNPFKLPDRYRADVLASVRAVDGATGELLYEELLENTDKLSPWDVIGGRGGMTPVGSRTACRRVREFCPKDDDAVLARDLAPAIDAFAEHVALVLTGSPHPAAARRGAASAPRTPDGDIGP